MPFGEAERTRRITNNNINRHQLKKMKQLNELAAEKNALTEKANSSMPSKNSSPQTQRPSISQAQRSMGETEFIFDFETKDGTHINSRLHTNQLV
jgi:hypothetical protein